MKVAVLVGLVAVLAGPCLGRKETGESDRPVVSTALGKVRGRLSTSRAGRTYYTFAGLPYAKPPLGSLRFEAPLKAEPWTGVREAVTDGPWCTQYNNWDLVAEPLGSEDCLYLSLYTPKLKGKLPVLVHFHGGGYTSGDGAGKTGAKFFMDEDVVVVDVNYRLSFLGFLSLEDEVLPGNQGMKDQTMALRWISQNIASFGGDPQRVTLVGESAGASSVYSHLISPLSKGLFHGGIAESGTSYNAFGVAAPGQARNTTLWLLDLLGCNRNASSRDAVTCLRSKDAYEIVSKVQDMKGWLGFMGWVGPVMEPKNVKDGFLYGPVKDWVNEPVPLMLGTTSAEGLLTTLYMDYVNMSYSWIYDNFETLAPWALGVDWYSSQPQKVVRAVRDYYFPNGDITNSYPDWVNLTMLFSDATFTIGILDGANVHPGDVYFYYFDYLGFHSFAGNATERKQNLTFGAFHTDEIIYLFNSTDFPNITGKDEQMSKTLVKLWTNFATYGNPTPRGSQTRVEWKKWTADCPNYLDISNRGLRLRTGLAEERYRFWKSLSYRDKIPTRRIPSFPHRYSCSSKRSYGY